ncbi:MAG: DUF2341 domain-containing protein [Elusimicrobiota bacterium]|nr:DUF2341 domain-containing protein [Elusimicrobiota bacterium]
MSYYIESGINTAATKIWVKLPSAAAGAGAVYLYSGSTSAAAASSMAGTFVMGDNFNAADGTAPGAITWSTIASAPPQTGSLVDIQSNRLRLLFGSPLNMRYYGLRSVNQYSFAAGRHYRASLNASTGGESWSAMTLCQTIYNTSFGQEHWLRFSIKHSAAGASYFLERSDYGSKTTLVSGAAGAGFRGVDILVNASSFTVLLDGTQIYSAVNDLPFISPYIYLEAANDSSPLQEFLFDDISVQPYSYPEPVYDSPGLGQGLRYPSGNFVSQVKDSSVSGTKYQGIDWASVTPSSASLTFEMRAHETDVELSTFTAASKGGNPAVMGRYVQYRLNLSTLDPRYTATLSSVTLTYGSPPNAPSGAAGTTISANSINWRWTDNSSAQYEEEGFRVLHGTTSVLMGSVAAGTTFWIETSLLPNTLYSRLIVGYNFAGVSVPSPVSKYTLAAEPSVSCDFPASTWLTGTLTCFNMAGFGNGGVAYYRYAWNTSASKAFWTGAETQWLSGTLPNPVTISGTYYLHVKSYNAENVPLPGYQTYGPYWYDKTAPTVTGFSPSSSPWSSVGVNPVVSVSDTGGSKLRRVRRNWTNSISRPATGDGGWQGWAYTVSGDSGTYNTNKATDGQWYLHIEVEDIAGNLGYNYSGANPVNNPYKIDTSIPTGGVIINGGNTYTPRREVTLSLTYADPESGVKEVSYNNDVNNPSTYTTPELARATTGWTLSEGDGDKRVYYRVTNNAGGSTYPYDNILLDSKTSLLGAAKSGTASGVMSVPAEVSTFTASATLSWKPTGDPLAGKTLTFYFNGSSRTAETDSYGAAAADFYVPAATGTYVYGVSFSTDGVYSASSSTGTVTATQRPTNLITEDINGTSNTSFTAKAILKDRDSDPAALIIGATVTFNFESMTATAATNGIGVATVTFTAPVPVGFYDYTASYAGGPVYAAKSATGRVGVGYKVTSLVASPVTAPVDTEFWVQAVLKDGAFFVAGATINFVFQNSSYTALTNASGIAVSSFTAPASSGTYNYTAFFYGDETYAASYGEATITVSRRQPSLAGDNLTGYVNASFQARAVLSDGALKVAGKPIVFVFETSSATVLTDANGVSTAVFNSGSLPRGSTCYYYFSGDAAYQFADSTATVSIERRPIALAASGVTTQLNSSFTAVATLKDMAFNPPVVVAGKIITFSFLGEIKTGVTGSTGVASVTYQSGVSTGAYEFYASFDQDDVYLAGNDTGTVTMAKRMVAITAYPAYSLANDAIKPVVALKDVGTNEYMSSQTIIFSYNGVPQSTTTGSSGGALGRAYATYPSTGVAGIYSYYADFPGNLLYAANSSTASITVSSRPVNLSAFPQTAVLGTTFTVTAEFRDGASNELKSGKAIRIAFSTAAAINSVTSAEGVVTSTFSTPLSTGTFSWFANFSGDTAYTAASSTGTITVTRRAPSLTPLAASKFVWDDVYFSATFLDDGVPIASKNINFYFQGSTRTAATNGSGTTNTFVAFSSISAPGIYGYTIAFAGDSNYSAQTGSSTLTVSVRPSNLSLGPISAIANSTVALTATLVDTNNGLRVMNGKPVNFTLQDSTYGVTAITDVNGTARAVYTSSSVINSYTYSATYYGNTNYGPSTSSNTLTVTLRPAALEMSDYYPPAGSSFTAYAVLKDFTTGGKIASRTISFLFDGVTKPVVTDAVGYASATYFAIASTASAPISASFAGDTLYSAASINKVVFPGKRNTALETNDMLGAVALDTFTVTARLKDFELGTYLPGKSVRFDFNGLPSSTTITDANGTARAVFSAPVSTGNYTYTATFDATALYNGYSNTSSVLVNRRNIILEPADYTGIPASSTFTASALLRDGGAAIPAKTLSFFFTPDTKPAITNGIGVASTSFMSPSSTGTFSYTVTFPDGDPLYKPGSASGSVGVVLKPTVLEVLDIEAVVGLPFSGMAKLRDIEMGNALVLSTKTISFAFSTAAANSITEVGVATAAFVAPLVVGTYTYTATFAGDGTYGSSQSTGTVTVKRRSVMFSIEVNPIEPYTLTNFWVKGTLYDGKVAGLPLANKTLKFFFAVSGTTQTLQTDSLGIASTTFYAGDSLGDYRCAGTFDGDASYSPNDVNEQSEKIVKINPRPTSVLANLGNGEVVWTYTFFGYQPTVYVFDPLAGNVGVAGLTVNFVTQGSTITGVTLAAPLGQATSSAAFAAYDNLGTYPLTARFDGNQTYAASILPGGTNWSMPQEGKVRIEPSPARIALNAIHENAYPDMDYIVSGVAQDYWGRANARLKLIGTPVRYRISGVACNPYPSNCPGGSWGPASWSVVDAAYTATATVHTPLEIGDYPIEVYFPGSSSFYQWWVSEDPRILRVGLRPTAMQLGTADPLIVGAQMPITIKVKLVSTSQGNIGVVGKNVIITLDGGTPQDVTTISGGYAQYSFPGKPVGNYTYTATFAGDVAYNSTFLTPVGNVTVQKNVTQIVGMPVTLVPAGNNFVAKVTLNVLVGTAYEPAQGRTINFTFPGNTGVGQVTDTQGIAQVTFTSPQTPGEYVFTAVLTENANDLGASAIDPNRRVQVVKRRTSLASVDVNPVYIQNSFTSTATLTDLDSAINLPSPLNLASLIGQTINFTLHRGGSEGDTSGTGATVASPLGRATRGFTSPLEFGSKSYTASFDGDTLYAAVTAADAGVNVLKRTTILAATVEPIAPTNTIFTATVTLRDNTPTLASPVLMGIGVNVPVKFVYNGITRYGTTNNSGVATATFTAQAVSADYTCNITYEGNATYASNTMALTVHVIKRPTSITGVEFNNQPAGTTFIAAATLTDDISGSGIDLAQIDFEFVGGGTFNAEGTTNGSGYTTAVFTAPLSTGNFNYTVCYPGDNTYAGKCDLINLVKVNVASTTLTTPDGTLLVNTIFFATATLKGKESGVGLVNKPVSVTYNSVLKGTPLTVVGGTAVQSFTPLSTGTFQLDVAFAGDAAFFATSGSATITVNRRASGIAMSNANTTVSAVFIATATLSDLSASPNTLVAGRQVNFQFNNGLTSTAATNGVGVATTSFTAPPGFGAFVITSTFTGDPIYNSTSTAATVFVAKRATQLTVSPYTIPALDVFNATATLKWSNGTIAVPGKIIRFTYKGVSQDGTATDVDGKSYSPYFNADASSGPWQVDAAFVDATDTAYDLSSGSNTITVLRRDCVAFPDNISMKVYDTFNATVTFRDVTSSSTPAGKYARVAFTPTWIPSTGTTNTATNGAGKAYFQNQTAPPESGIYKVESWFLGDATYNPSIASTATVTVTKRSTQLSLANVSTMIGRVFTATATLSNFSVLLDDRDVLFTFEGRTFNAKTGGASGAGIAVATFTVTISTGGTQIFADFAGDASYLANVPSPATATVTAAMRPTAITNYSFMAVKDLVFIATGTLKDIDGLEVPGRPVSFEFNTVTLTTNTNSVGVATAAYLANVATGLWPIWVHFDGDYKYIASTTTLQMTVQKRPTSILPLSSNITVRALDVFYATATLRDMDNTPLTIPKPVYYIFSSSSFTKVTDGAGVAVSTYAAPASSGTYYANIYFDGDSEYEPSAAAITVTVQQRPAGINLATLLTSVKALDPFKSTATLTDLNNASFKVSTRPVTFSFSWGENTIASTDGVGVATASYSATAIADNDYTLTGSFAGDATYASTSTVIPFPVIKRDGFVTGVYVSTRVLDVFTAIGTFYDSVTLSTVSARTMKFGLQNGSTLTATSETAGVYSVDFTAPAASGTYILSIWADADATYNATSVYYSSATLARRDSSIALTGPTASIIGSSFTAGGTMYDSVSGGFAQSRLISFHFQGTTVPATTNVFGATSTVYTALLTTGTFALQASFAGDATYNPSVSTRSIVVVRYPTKLAAPAITVTMNEVLTATATLTNYKDDAVQTQTLTFSFLTLPDQTPLTNGSGIAYADYSTVGVASGTYMLPVSYAGDSQYESTNTAIPVLVKKRTALLTTDPVTVKALNIFTATATLSDLRNTSQKLNGQTVIFEFLVGASPITNSGVTDINGVAVSTFTAPAEIGGYQIRTYFSGNATYYPLETYSAATVDPRPARLMQDNAIGIIDELFRTTATLVDIETSQPILSKMIVFGFGVNPSSSALTAAGGKASVGFTAPSSSGPYALSSAFAAGDTTYTAANSTAVLTVIRRTALLTAPDISGIIDEVFTATVTVSDALQPADKISGSTMSFAFSGNTFLSLTSAGGIAVSTFSAPAPSGMQYATINFYGTDRHLPNSTTVQISVDKRPSAINPETIITRASEIFTATATLRDTLKPSDNPAGRQLWFTFGASSFTALTDSLGLATATFMSPPSSGTARLDISFAGDPRYQASAASTTVTVLQRLSLMTLNPVTIAAMDVLTAGAILSDKNIPGVFAGNRNITFSFRGENFNSVTDGDGIAVSTFAGPVSSGTYLLEASFAGDSVYAASYSSVLAVVLQRAADIAVTDSSAYPLETFTAAGLLKDRTTQGPVAGRYLGFLLNSVSSGGVTNDVGVATVTYTPPSESGAYSLRAEFAGDATYASTTSFGTVQVLQRPTTVYALDAGTIALDVFTASATLSDIRFSTVIAGQDIVFTFEGVSSTGTTDAYGVAAASFTAPVSSGTYYYQARFAGSSVYAVSYSTGAVAVGTRFTRVVARDMNANVGEPFTLKGVLTDPAKEGLDGFFVPNVQMQFKFKDKDGVLVDTAYAITNEIGVATVTLNGPGEPSVYFYTASFYGNYTYSASSATAMVKVGLLTSIVAFDVETVALEKFTGKAKLTDYLSTTLDDKPVRFTFLDQINSGRTSADGNSGVASSSFTAPSSSGTYYYYAYFDGDSIYSASNATATVIVKLRPSGILVYPATAMAFSSFTATMQLGNILEPYDSIAGRNVDISFKGNTITAVTDGDGLASALFFASASSGTFSFSASFSGDDTYSSSVRVGTVTVTRRPINMLTYNVTDVTANSTFTAKVQMKENDGDPVPGLGVSFDFGGAPAIGTADAFGMAEVIFTAPASSGVYAYNAVFYEDSLYVGTSSSGSVTVGPRPTLVFTSATSAKLGDPVSLSARLVDVSNQGGIQGEPLSFYFEGSTLTALTDSLGVSTVTFAAPLSTGSYSYEAVFNGNGVTYLGSSSSAPVTVAMNLTTLVAATGISLKIFEPLQVEATIMSGDVRLPGLPISFNLMSSSLTSITDGFGKATATFSTMDMPSTGTYNYSADYSGGTLYMASSDTSNVVSVYRRDSLLIARDAQAVPSKAFTAEAKFYDNVNGSAFMGNIIPGKTIIFELNYSTFTQTRTAVTSALGVSTASFIAPSSTGTYLLTARFGNGDPIYEGALSSVTLTVLLDDGTGAIKTRLRLESATSYITKTFVASGTLTATELPVPGKYVLFEFFNGASTSQALGFTDELGLSTASFTAPASSGAYLITASFSTGDPNYSSATGTGTVTALRYPDSLAAQAVVAYAGEVFPAKAVLRDSLTQLVIAGRTVTFQFFNGISTATKMAVTSSTGSAETTFTAPSAPGDYTFKALFAGTSEYADSQDAAAILIASKGSSADLIAYEIFIGTGEVFVAMSSFTSKGLAVPGKAVSITFQGITRISTTTSGGLAFSTFTAPSSSGTFVLQASFAGDDAYNAALATAAVSVVFRKQPEPPATLKVEVASASVTLVWAPIIQDQLDGYIIEEGLTLRGKPSTTVIVSSSTLGYTSTASADTATYFKIKTKLDDDQEGATSLIVEVPSKTDDPDRVPNYYYISPDEGEYEYAAWVKIPGKVMDKVTAAAADFKIEVKKDNRSGFLASYTITAHGDQKKMAADLKASDKKGVRLTIAYPVKSGTGTSATGDLRAIYWFNGVEWIKLGGEIDVQTGEIYTYSRVLGQFAIKAAPLASSFTLTKVAPRIFSPDEADTNVNRARFYFENPAGNEVTIRIFDITGSLVRRNLESEGANIMFWNGKNQAGTLVKGGVYIYQMEAGEEVLTGTVVVAK